MNKKTTYLFFLLTLGISAFVTENMNAAWGSLKDYTVSIAGTYRKNKDAKLKSLAISAFAQLPQDEQNACIQFVAFGLDNMSEDALRAEAKKTATSVELPEGTKADQLAGLFTQGTESKGAKVDYGFQAVEAVFDDKETAKKVSGDIVRAIKEQ
ncbi:MAG: hypothetical protein JW725_01070 [Candidatus Babeliaceae bacterium]|nr:hypothetical protein [Candidatus Babeliaceae bacterium]